MSFVYEFPCRRPHWQQVNVTVILWPIECLQITSSLAKGDWLKDLYAWYELFMMGVCQNGILKIFAIKIPSLKKHHSTSSFGLFLDSFGVPQLSIGKAMAIIMSTLVAFQGYCSLLISLYKCFAYYGCNGGVRNRSSSRICLFKFLIKILVVSAYICLCSFSEIFYPHSAQKIHRARTFSYKFFEVFFLPLLLEHFAHAQLHSTPSPASWAWNSRFLC